MEGNDRSNSKFWYLLAGIRAEDSDRRGTNLRGKRPGDDIVELTRQQLWGHM